MRARLCNFAVAAVLTCSGLTGCGGNNEGVADAAPVSAVQTTTAKVQPLTDVIDAQGVLYPLHQASLAPKVSAPVERFFVNRGSRVHRGQLLAMLSNQDLQASVVAARGAYDQAQAVYDTTTSSTLPEAIQAAEASVATAKSALDDAQKVYDSDENLFRQGAMARNQLSAAGVALTSAKNAYATAEKRLHDLQTSGAAEQRRAAKGQLETAHGQYLSAMAQLQYTKMRSPIDGVVAERTVYEGDIAPAGTPLFIIMNTSKVILRVHIPQNLAARLHVGDKATLHVPGMQITVPAKVTIVSPALDPNSTTVEVWVEADNPRGELTPGTSAEASILAREIPHALVVPDSAVLVSETNTARVMVVGADNTAHSVPVVTGVRHNGMVEILSGLHGGERVIVGGAYGLPDNSKVRVVPAQKNGSAS